MSEEIERCANTGFGVEFLEHLHRYRIAQSYCRGKVVLDAACGSGYGTAILAEVASHVYGIDISEDAVKLCKKTFRKKNISFQTASIGELPWPDHFFDVIVSFETIEHVSKSIQKKFISEIRRLLKPDGTLVISSPDKQYYTIERNKKNPYHIAEFFRKDFFKLIDSKFKYCQKADQKIFLCSLVKNDSQKGGLSVFSSSQQKSGRAAITDHPVPNFWYNIAVASNVPVAPVPDSINIDIEGKIFSPDGKTSQEAYIEKLSAHIKELDDEHEILIKERQEHLDALAKYQSHVRELDDERKSLVKERKEHLAALDKCQTHIKELDVERESLIRERGEHLAAIAKYQTHVKELDAERTSLVKERKSLVEERQEHLAAIAKYQTHVKELDAERTSLVKEREEHLAALDKCQTHIKELDGERASLIKERTSLIKERQAHLDELAKYQTHVKELDAERTSLVKERESLIKERTSLVKEREEHLAALDKCQSHIKELDGERASLIKERTSLIKERQAHLDELAKYQTHVKEQIGRASCRERV